MGALVIEKRGSTNSLEFSRAWDTIRPLQAVTTGLIGLPQVVISSARP